MSDLLNLTPFAAVCVPSLSRNDELLTLIVVAGRFALPQPGTLFIQTPPIAADQEDVRFADEYRGAAGSSSLLYEGQSSYTRPCTDIYLEGRAWAPQGRAVTRSVVSLLVGRCQKAAVVFGDRVWKRGILGLSQSDPQPFESLPLVYERCFGGWPEHPDRSTLEAAEHNPVGCGLYSSASEAVDRPLPNIEDPAAVLGSVKDRPRPCGFGPIARHWRPRRTFAGTYEKDWIAERAPLWPTDLDDIFFAAAAPGLQAFPHLQGGERVQLSGVSPAGPYEFLLPQYRLQARFELQSSSVWKSLIMDAVLFEPEKSSFTLYWRAYLVADPLMVGTVAVRALDSWEVAR